ncbi:unnamed protein product [[Candida] boidinii]|uniref:Unnamed protein product n=1 Tax=Candida boidinii TaxID=5477 RepID=A0A9W6WGZ5_CANBO|nr:hypothetical protein BVG19_g3283 [[Candida] boidinii]OWB49475.1 hypothetical protein B5S27_g1016 [[Candida] boidinii]OWB84865.1 hypothetical protein B5S33_g3521 [[Candida] boidinii]GME72061.1 unnamed protein product [[Candida] boidinii]GMG00361.1 unnamed protein product [[Candida] boidinii]
MSEGKFMPKQPVQLNPPKDDPITIQQLSLCDGEQSSNMFIGIKGDVFDVTKNENAYGVGKGYHVLVGRDASRALGKSSLKPEDTDLRVSWDYSTLNDKQLKVLDDWYTFFSNRYNIVGKVSDLPKK